MRIHSGPMLRVGLLGCLGGSSKPGVTAFYWAANPKDHLFSSIISKPRRNYHVEQGYADPSPRCYSLLSSSSLAISSRLSSWKRRWSRIDGNKNLLLVILVTPAHLSLLEDGNDFIPHLLRHEAELSQPGQVFDVMAAVVDGIPHQNAPREEHGSRSGASLSNPCPGASTRDGSEGVSVAVLDSSSAAPGLWAIKQDLREGETMAIQQRCTLTFTLPSSTRANTEAQKLEGQDHASRMLELPVANTVFQNGRTATLFAQRWVLQPEHQANVVLVPGQKVWLPQQALDLNGLAKEIPIDQSLHSDLIPITPPRTIKAAIGNIIRRLSADGSPEANTPASSELERAIITGIKNGSIPDQPAEVWALVKPRGYAPHMGCETMRANPEFDELHQVLLSGCRLHKVLSGGGGWGEKQGLLALDPDSSYGPRQQALQLSIGDEHDTEAEELQALGNVVKPGDIVTFYVRSASLAQTNALDLKPHLGAHNSLAPLYLMFGSLPSTMDVMHDLLSTKTTSEETNCVMLDGCFGMLSEQGMSLTSTFKSHDIHNVTTKLDAPYTLFTVRARPMAPYSEGVCHLDPRGGNQDCNKATNSNFKATSAANARMSAPNRGSAKVSFWNGIWQRREKSFLDIFRIGAIPVRPFATDSQCYSQAKHKIPQKAPSNRKPQAKPGVKVQKPKTKSLIRKHVSQSGPLSRYVKDEQSLPFLVNMLDRKMNTDPAENNASESQLDIWKYHESEAEKQMRKTREPRRVATDRNTPIRFISDKKTEDAHIDLPNKLGSKSSGPSNEQNAEPIEIRRHLSSGQTPKPPSTAVRIQHVTSLHIRKHHVTEKVVTTLEGNLLIRTHSVGDRSRESASDLSHPTSAGANQEIKPDSPRYHARELHSRYSLRSLHEISPSKNSRAL